MKEDMRIALYLELSKYAYQNKSIAEAYKACVDNSLLSTKKDEELFWKIWELLIKRKHYREYLHSIKQQIEYLIYDGHSTAAQ